MRCTRPQHGSEQLAPISGMAVGWSTLGLLVAGATDLIEDNKTAFDLLTYVGALYIAYLSYKIATSKSLERGENIREAGLWLNCVQIVNEGSRIHFLVLMTSFRTYSGQELQEKSS